MTAPQRVQLSQPELVHDRTPTAPAGSVAGLVRGHRLASGPGQLHVAHAPEPVPVADAVPLRRHGASPQRLADDSAGAGSTAPPTPVRAPSLSGGGASSPPVVASGPRRVHEAAAAPNTVGATVTASAVASPGTVAAPTSAVTPPMPARRMPVRSAPPSPAAVEVSAPQRLPLATPAAVTHAATGVGTADAPGAVPARRVVQADAPAPDRPGAPLLGSTRIVRRVGAPLATRPASMVDHPRDHQRDHPRDQAPDSGPVVPIAPQPPQRLPLVPGQLPERASRPMPVTDTAPRVGSAPTPRPRVEPSVGLTSGGRGATAPPAAAFTRSPSTARSAPLVGRARAIQRLSDAPPALVAAASPAAGTSAPPTPVPVRRGVQRAPESVPPDLRSELEPRLGESLDGVRVHRGPEVGDAARSIQAKAFATGGEVFLPDEHGPANAGEGRKILAHELTHVVQQRRLGSSLPPENTPDGARLEQEARVVGGQAPVPARPVAASDSPAPQRLTGVVPPRRPRSLATAAAPVPDLASQAAIVAQVHAAAVGAGVPAHVSPSGPPRSSSAPMTTPTASGPGVALSTTSPVQRLDDTSAAAGAAGPSTHSAPDVSDGGGGQPPDIEELARQLYPRFRNRLRNDLLNDRERSGRLFDRG